MTVYVERNGSRLTPFMLHQIERLNRDLKVKFGCEVVISSGIRLPQEQIDVFLARYVTAANIRSRFVYDTRVWNGVRYYRISSAGTVASPGTSNHEIQGSTAAVDLRDTGRDAGLMVRGSARSNWLRANAANYGLVASGFGFGEPWHYDVLNIFSEVPGATAPAGNISSGFNQEVQNQQNWLLSRGYDLGAAGADGRKGDSTTTAFKRYQSDLRHYGYVGLIDGEWGSGTQAAHNRLYVELHKPAPPAPSGNPFGISSVEGLQKIAKLYGYKGSIDNSWGSGSASGFTEFLRRFHGYSGNDTLGPKMWAAIARWLRGRWGYSGNDTPGPKMRAALQRAEDANQRDL